MGAVISRFLNLKISFLLVTWIALLFWKIFLWKNFHAIFFFKLFNSIDPRKEIINGILFFIDNLNPLEHTYEKPAEQLDLYKTKEHQSMSRMSYGNDDIDDNLPF